MCLELIILVLWQSLDPLVATQIQSVSSNDPNVCVVCQSRSSTFLIIFLVFKVRYKLVFDDYSEMKWNSNLLIAFP
jgi:hypothetical protein